MILSDQTKAVYMEMLDIMKIMEIDYCQSWWARQGKNALLTTKEVNKHAKKLVQFGYLTIDKSRTSRSTGTCYRLTDKKLV